MNDSGYLALTDGSIYCGRGMFYDDQILTGEVVFSTSSCGYVEILTDPSFCGQIVVLANPEIGNYGVNPDDFQSDGIKAKALVVRNLSLHPSSFRSMMSLGEWLLKERVPVLFDIDTRSLISHIRDHGAMMAAISKNMDDPAVLYEAARSAPPMMNNRLSPLVSVKESECFLDGLLDINGRKLPRVRRGRAKIVVMDFGVKRSILRYLNHFGAELVIIPSDASRADIMDLIPDGLFLSNGPGDPGSEVLAIETIRSLLGKLPIFGVCLGHQILAQALSASTYKLKFGHRGSNQSVKDPHGKILTTAQNHGFAVQGIGRDLNAFIDINISDQTNEGIDLPHLHCFSVQYHPEGAPGPLDAIYLFEKFFSYIDEFKYQSTKKNIVQPSMDAL